MSAKASDSIVAARTSTRRSDLWRHLWAGGTGPFHGHSMTSTRSFRAAAGRRALTLPIWLGGRDERLRRADHVADATTDSDQPAQYAVRVPLIRAAGDAGDAPTVLGARSRVAFGRHEFRTTCWRTPGQMVGELRAFEKVGLGHIAVDFVETDPARSVALIEKFDAEVVAAFR